MKRRLYTGFEKILYLGRWLSAVAACAAAAVASAQTPTEKDLREVGLPWVEVTTVGGEEPTCDYLSPPPYATGSGIANATKVPGRLRIFDRGEYVYDSGDYAEDAGGMTIRIRGNSSAYQPKKPFKVKLEKKADLLCRGDNGVFADRDWLLMKEEFLPKGGALLNLMVGLEMARLCGMPWEPQARFVNLTVNGDYRGVYMLCEAVERNVRCRVDVDKETGYIVEFDPYWWNEDLHFSTARHEKEYTFKYPDPDEVTKEGMERIRDDLDRLEDALWAGTYPALIDVGSMATWLMAHDLLGTYDAYGSNIFITRHDTSPGSKLMMGPLWDFDSIMRTEGAWAPIHNRFDFYFYYLLCLAPGRSNALAYTYLSRWEEAGKDVPEKMEEYLLAFAFSDEAAALQASNEWDLARWGHPGPSVEGMVLRAISWFRDRAAWMQRSVSTLDIGLSVVRTDTCRRSSACCDLQGRRLNGIPQKGIYIRNGRKYVR